MDEGFYYATSPITGERVSLVVQRASNLESGEVRLAAFNLGSEVGQVASFYFNYQLMQPEEVQADLLRRRYGLRNLSSLSDGDSVFNRLNLEREIRMLEEQMRRYMIPIPKIEQTARVDSFKNNPFEVLSM